MSKFFAVEPEVAGGFGPNTILDRNVHPTRVDHLHYELNGWLGDELLETTPCWIVTESLARQIREAGLAGVEFGDVEVSTSDEFRERYPDRSLPKFLRLNVTGTPRKDDFGVGDDLRLVVSEKALNLLRQTNRASFDVEPLD
jgi:hypothetical protein